MSQVLKVFFIGASTFYSKEYINLLHTSGPSSHSFNIEILKELYIDWNFLLILFDLTPKLALNTPFNQSSPCHLR